jgi:hypothetical protein
VREPLDDDRPDDGFRAWAVEGPSFGRRPAAVEPLRDELARYLAPPRADVPVGPAGEVEASRGAGA